VSPNGKRVMTDGEAYEVTRILKSNVTSGTGRTASGLGCPAAGKTGTTDNHNDAWFVGYTPHLSTAVWYGYPDALISTGMQGGGLPTSIWTAFMQTAKGDDCDDFETPKEAFESSPFFGKYSSTGTSSDYSYSDDDSSYTEPPPDDTTEEDTGGAEIDDDGGYDPRLYEAPPQPAPSPPRSPSPPVQPGGGVEP
jgi:penicillin-binding protein 1A